jgi:tripartite-type tricarboxylate transporter receptor subunit TctC
MMFATAASVVGLIRDGKVRPLAVTTSKRTALMPDLPTVAELGISGFDATTWHGLVAPAGTSKEIVGTLNHAMVTALDDPAVRKALMDFGVDIVGSTPKDFEAYIQSEIPKWAAVINASGARLE